MAAPLVWIAALLSTAFGQSVNLEPVVVGQTFIAGSTDPTQGSTAWALISHGIAEKLFTVDQAGNIVGQLADSVTKVSKFVWAVNLKAGYSFSDGTPVTAEHVADALTELNQKNTNAQASVGTMTMTPVDDLTLRIQSEQATPVMEAVLAEWVFVVFLVKDEQTFFTGPFAIKNFVKGDKFELVPNTYYPRASERELVIPELVIRKFSNGESLAAALKSSQLDMAFHLPVASLNELRAKSGVTIKSFEVGYQYMMWHNTRRAPLSDPKVRQAVDVALDRPALSQELRGGNPTRKLFPEGTPYALEEAEPHADQSAAERLLEEAGWIKNDDGTREKDGVPLTLKLVAYPQRPGLVTMQPVINATLTALGFTVNAIVTSGESWDELDQIMAEKDFDLLLWAQHTLPAGDPQWFLNAFFRSDAGSNHAGLSSTKIDGLIDALADTKTLKARLSATEAAQNAILEEVPVSILVTPSWHVGFSSVLSNYVPWGSDYYIIHADFGIGPTTTATTTATDASEVDDANSAVWMSRSGLCIASLLLLGSLL